ncbi:MAG: ferritin [Phycisphaerae bacterium]|nr:ferritin [Phycisphaerae bacterium]
MLDPKLEAALNKQINMEFSASYAYLAMAAHFDSINLQGFARWMEQQSAEEQAHAKRLFTYLLDRGGRVGLEQIEKPTNDFESVMDVFQHSLKQEQSNSQAINRLYALAKELNDYATQSHLTWFLDEQVEEEKTMGEVIAKLQMIGDDKSALLILDEQMAQPRADGG